MKLKHLVIITLLAVGISAQAKTPVESYGRLIAKSVGGKGGLYDSSGTKQVTLRGMSMFWSSEPDGYNFDHPATVAWLQSDWLVSVLRVPVGVISPSTVNKGYLDAPSLNLNRALAVISGAIAQGIYVIVDWHPLDAVGTSSSTNGYTSQAVNLFSTLATQYKNTPNILWEVWNEPTGNNSDVVTHANACISAIRNAGNKNLVIVGSSGWSSQPDQVGNVTDAQSNVAYTLHFYAGDGAHDAYRSNMTNAINKGRTVFVTEWGTTGSSGDGSYNWGNSQTWLTLLDANKVSSCNWDIGTQHSTPGDYSTPVQLSAALQSTAAANGNWTPSDLTTSGKAVRNYLRTANNGLFTLPDTTLRMLTPLAVNPTTAYLTDAIHITAVFSKAVTWKLLITGQTSGATYSPSQTSDTVDISWRPSTDHMIGKLFTGEKVSISFSGFSLPGTTASLTLQPTSIRIQSPTHLSTFTWTVQGLRLPAGTAQPGLSYTVRVMDLRGQEIGFTRSALAREVDGEVMLDLAPVVRGSGLAFVELEGPDGQRSQILLPPLR